MLNACITPLAEAGPDQHALLPNIMLANWYQEAIDKRGRRSLSCASIFGAKVR